MTLSTLDQFRKQYTPKLPTALRMGLPHTGWTEGEKAEPKKDRDTIKSLFPKTYGLPMLKLEGKNEATPAAKPLRVGVVLSGGQAPGGHNVIAGIFDGLRSLHAESRLYGFTGGPSGLEKAKYQELTPDIIDAYRNTGGFDIIGSGRTKLETTEQFDRCIETIKSLNLDGIVVIGGDDSNTNAAVLGEYLRSKGVAASVVGVPKTIDGDLKNAYIQTSFGFDTAVKTYSELIGNIARDARSARKYWHFIKLMGRSASHITLEAALRTQPNAALISEEVEAEKLSLSDIAASLADMVVERAAKGKNYGVVLVPEGLIEFVPSMKTLIAEVNDLLAHHEDEFSRLEGETKSAWVSAKLSKESASTFNGLPDNIRLQLLMDRDPHGNVQVSRIETEALLAELVERKLAERTDYTGSFSTQRHFFGYEGRAAAPSNFDADYCYGLGYTAAALINGNKTGYICYIRNLSKGVDSWEAGGLPITMLMNMEQRHGKPKPVIEKALVELDGPAFAEFASKRVKWRVEDAFLYPGPIQYFGPTEVADVVTRTLELEGR